MHVSNETKEVLTVVNDISSYCYEKPALYLLSLLLGNPNDVSGLEVPSDFGLLGFKGMDLLQERGQIPSWCWILNLKGEVSGCLFRARISF